MFSWLKAKHKDANHASLADWHVESCSHQIEKKFKFKNSEQVSEFYLCILNKRLPFPVEIECCSNKKEVVVKISTYSSGNNLIIPFYIPKEIQEEIHKIEVIVSSLLEEKN